MSSLASYLLVATVIVSALADLPSVHEKPVNMTLSTGDRLTLRIPSATTIWHREFSDGRAKQYVEACNEYLDVCEKWRSGTLGKDHHDGKVTVAKDGTLDMPTVTSSDSAQYYTYYADNTGLYHYVYFNVVVAGPKSG